MPVFRYKGVTAAGKTAKGIRDGDNARSIQNQLRREGIFPTEIQEQTGKADKQSRDIDLKRFARGVSTRELSVVTRQLATLLHAGVTLIESLGAVVDQTENEHLKLMLSQIKQKVNEGSSLADALAQHPKAFPELYCNMVRAGESSGALDVVLSRLADFTENQAKLRSKVIGTLTYPFIMILVGLGIVTMLMVVVIPKISQIFEDQKIRLPLPTRVLMGFSYVLGHYWWLIILLLVGLAFWVRYYVKTDRGRARWDRMKLSMPIAGPIMRMLSIARFAKTLATLLSSGVPLLSALTIVRNIVGNSILAQAIDSARESIKEGESIAVPLKRSGEFPPVVIHMIAVGERSGQLEEMLNNVANSFQDQAETRINALTSLLEPLMIVFMGGAVGFIVFSILLPIMQLNTFAR